MKGGQFMLARSHRICSIAIVEMGLLATNLVLKNPLPNLVILLATGIGSSLPDLDQYNSKASRKSIINFSLIFRHRGITHSLLGWILFSWGMYWLMNHVSTIRIEPNMVNNYWSCIWLGLVLGYFLHLLEDSFSNQGVDWLAPFIKRSGKPLFHYKVGGFAEQFMSTIAYLGIVVMSLYWVWIYLMPTI